MGYFLRRGVIAILFACLNVTATQVLAGERASDYVMNMMSVYEFSNSEEVSTAQNAFLEERRSTLAPGCADEITLNVTPGRSISISFTGNERIEFREGESRPVHATWLRGLRADYCGTEHIVYARYSVSNGGPVQIVETVLATRRSARRPSSPLIGRRPTRSKPAQAMAPTAEPDNEEENGRSGESDLYPDDDYDPFD